jgi:hypothetical protein
MARQQSFEAEYNAAVRRSKMDASVEPRAKKAYYEPRSRQVIVELKSGATFGFPCKLAQGLAEAADEDLATLEISPSAAGLHWPKLDADFNLQALLQGVFGDHGWMQKLQRRRRSTPKKPRPAARRT